MRTNVHSTLNAPARATADMLDFFNRHDSIKYGSEGAPLHDPCTVAYLLNPGLFEGKLCNLTVETESELTMGHTAVDFWHVTGGPKRQLDPRGRYGRVLRFTHRKTGQVRMTMERRPSIVVVGSVNLDLAASVEKLPVAGETVTGAELNRFPGGKGANQVLAARRLDADVYMVARVGKDANADEALALLRAADVDLSRCGRDEISATGVALIAVSVSGENQIVVAPGANRCLTPEMIDLPVADALICQLEVPVAALLHAREIFDGFFCINLAPALDVPADLIDRADLLVVNETEAAFYGSRLQNFPGLLAITYGADGAVLHKGGKVIAKAKPPSITAVDTTGAGDAFTAALTVSLIEGKEPQAALEFACATGAAAATKAGAQTSLPFREDVEALMRRG